MIIYRLALFLAALAVGGCASVPGNISTPVAGPEVREVRADPQAHIGRMVRWGGTIAEVRNLENQTVVTVVARPTTRKGEPLGGEPSTGRFMIEADLFLDPEEYEAGRRITAVGRFAGIRSAKVGQYAYDYPVLSATDLHLWQEYARREYPPYYYDPYWYHPYPWRYPYFHGHPWYY